MTDSSCKSQLAEHKWKAFNSVDAGLLPDGQIQRYIDGIPHNGHNDLIRFCERFVSVTNYDADSSINYAYVAAPLVDNEARTGNWRHVRTEIVRVDSQNREGNDGTKFRLVQTLAEGWLTSLAYADARLADVTWKTGDGGTNQGGEVAFLLRWVAVNPDTMFTMAFGFSSQGASGDLDQVKCRRIALNDDGSNPDVSLGSDYQVLTSRAYLAEDGSGVVEVMVAKPQFTMTAFQRFGGISRFGRTYFWDVPEALAQGVVDAQEASGASCSVSYDSREGLVNIVVDLFDRANSNIPTTDYVEAPYEHSETEFNPHAAEVVEDPGVPTVGTIKRVSNRATPEGTFRTVSETVTKDKVDEEEWYDAGFGRNGDVKRRVAEGLTWAEAKVIANSSPPTGNWFTIGSIQGPDRFGMYRVEVTATPAPASYSASTPYKSYKVSVSGKKTQYRNVDGNTESRTLDVTYYYVGDTSESAVKTYLETTVGDLEGIRVTPNGTGEYFQGFGYKITSTGAWS